MLDQRDAKAIAKKLKASTEQGRRHELASVRYGGKIIATFGIRRGSGAIGHDYIPGQIHVTNKEAKLLVQCPMSFDDWIALMKRKQII